MAHAPGTLFLGSKDLGLSVLRLLHESAPGELAGAITIDDSSDSRTALSRFREYCEGAGIPLWIARDRAHAAETIRDVQPRRCFVVGWYWLISRETLESVPQGFLGLHYSRLPAYRGTSPLVWQMINGEPEAAFSVFTLTEGMDEGDLWAQASVPIGPDDYIGDVLERLNSAAVTALSSLYPKLLSGTAVSHQQPHEGATFCTARLPDDGEIDFNKSSLTCYNFIRAQSHPYPGAFTNLAGERLIIWRAKLLDVTYYGRPGQVARIDRNGAWVICGDSRPLLLQRVGWKGQEMSAHEVIRSVKTRLPS
jgi:methionyl-tRNA formyltransferase